MIQKYSLLTQWLLLLLSLVGVAISLYLTAVHYEHLPLLCSAHGVVNCELVTSSPYSVLAGTTIPITVPGLGWAIISAGLAVVGLRVSSTKIASRVVLVQCIWSFLALLTVLYLVYVEIVLLHTLCAWCTALHVVILLMFLLTLVLLLSEQPASAKQGEEEEEKPLPSTSRFH